MPTIPIRIQANVSADKQKAWEYYNEPAHICNWNFASPDWQCPSASNDLRVGGKYTARMEPKDGSFGFDMEAEYLAIDQGNSFKYLLADGRQVEVYFEPAGQETLVVVQFDAEEENDIELQKAGWQAILDNFKKYTNSN